MTGIRNILQKAILLSIIPMMIIPAISFTQSMIFDHITIDEGLSNNTIYAITQDSEGFLWFGSRDGLNRYDGYEFRIFKSDPGDSLSLPNNNIQALHTARNGDIWIGVRTGGLCVFQKSTQSLDINPLRNSVNINWDETTVVAILEDSHGDIWIGTTGQGVIRVLEGGNKVEHYATFFPETPFELANDHCFSFAEDKESNIWMGMSEEAVQVFERSSRKVRSLALVEGHPLYSYRKSLLIRGNTLWIGTEGNGLHRYNIESRKFTGHYIQSSLIWDMEEMHDGKIMISTDGQGLYLFDPVNISFENIRFSPTLNNSLNTNALYELYIDKDQNVWIGSFNGGVNVFKANKPEFYTYLPMTMSTQVPGAQSVLAFCQDRTGRVLVGMDGGGLWEFDAKAHSYTRFENSLKGKGAISSNVITVIFEDSQANLWVGTYAGGLNRIDAQSGDVSIYRHDVNDPESINNDNVWDILEDDDGYLWIATLGGGLDRFDPRSQAFRHYTPDPEDENSLTDWNARVLAIDGQKNIWIGTEYGGINKFSPKTGQFQSWEHLQGDSTGLQSSSVLCIHVEDDHLWVGTEGGGLHKMSVDGTPVANYSEADGLPSNVINAIMVDDDQTLWLSTNRGVSAFSESRKTFTNYDNHDGLASNQFNPNASIKTEAGEMLFGNIKGVNGFIPEDLHPNDNLPDVVFTDFTLFNASVKVGVHNGRAILSRPLNESPTIRLMHWENVFTIAFAAIEYTNPSRNRYAYRMLGFEENWTEVSARQRKVTYTNLDPGEYVFEVRATNNSGKWSENVRRLNFIIEPPFYSRLWFKTIVGLLLVAGVLFLLSYWDWRRKEKHREQLILAEQEILKLKNERLEEEVNQKNSELSAALLQSAHKNNALDEMRKELADLSTELREEGKNRHDIQSLMRKIETEITSADYWEQFQLNFEQIHQQFAQQLHELHPNLTQNDLRLCCLIRINLTNREIASIQNISLSGIEKSKYRLKRKLGLSGDMDLNQYILSLS